MIHQERIAKLELLHAIAHSQSALARILDAVADVAEQDKSKVLAQSLYKNVQQLTQYQAGLCQWIPGIQLSRPKKGTPTKPWSGAASIQLADETRGVRKDKPNEYKAQAQKKGGPKRRSQGSQSKAKKCTTLAEA